MLLGAGEHTEVACPAERAAFLTLAPTWLTLGGIASDDAFLSHLESVLTGELTASQVASKYQRRGSRGWRVVLHLAETAVQYAIARELRLGKPGSRRTLNTGLWRSGPTIGFAPDGEPMPSHRKRWRPMIWREEALGALLARGAGNCLEAACSESAGNDGYCIAHAKSARAPVGIPQQNPELAQALHDRAVASMAELLAELGVVLEVP